MALAGWAGFTEPYLFDSIYLAGYTLPMVAVSASHSPGVIPLPTHGGTHKIQRPYRGDDMPKDYDALQWTLSAIKAVDSAPWYAIKRAKASGSAVYFGAGVRQVDSFAATSGQSYKLTRPLASGIVPGVTSVTHPTVVLLDGAVSPGSASVSGQVVTAAATGLIEIEYTPVHLVVVTSYSESIPQHNEAVVSLQLEEVLVV